MFSFVYLFFCLLSFFPSANLLYVPVYISWSNLLILTINSYHALNTAHIERKSIKKNIIEMFQMISTKSNGTYFQLTTLFRLSNQPTILLRHNLYWKDFI